MVDVVHLRGPWTVVAKKHDSLVAVGLVFQEVYPGNEQIQEEDCRN